ncbi:MAG: asparagine synthase (glutamine-hydrolyzing) [Planctomycetota bacterium]
MCGFAGYLSRAGDPAPFAERLPRAVRALGHRGPDDQGIFTSKDRHVGLGHARLNVIDPEGGAQPMTDPETGVVVVANGEIYNFRELGEEHEARGRPPRTRSDTEALLTALALDGTKALSRLRGMFAFAAYDPRADRVVIARDRMGQKPVVYAHLPGGGIAFASEFDALLTLLGETPEPDSEALSLYLSFGYVPAPYSAFRGLRKLPAAHFIVAGREHPEAWWRRPAPDPAFADDRAAAEAIREAIADAVRARLVADVPIGAFLSGGLDSGIVVAEMAEALATPVRTFTVRQPQPEYDESDLARSVAERYGTEHEEIVIEPPDVEEIPRILGRWGEPFGDSSALAQALISRAARPHVTVALTGDGGDEAFGGYDRFSILDRIGGPGGRMLAALRPLLFGRLRRAGRIAAMPPWRRYYEFYEIFNGGARDDLLTPHAAAKHGEASARFLFDLYTSFPGGETDRMLATDAATWLPDDLNPKVDIASMAVALECRSPLQDHLLVETCAKVPAGRHVRGNGRKRLLLKAIGDRLPAPVLAAKKCGFAAPVEHWFRGDLAGFLSSKLEGDALRSLGLVRPEAVKETVAGLTTGSRTGRPRIRTFVLLALALWAESVL